VTKLFYKHVFNIKLQDYYSDVPDSRDIAQSLVYSSMKDFEEVTKPEFGDLMLIKLQGIESHIAVFLGEGIMFHSTIHSGSVIERISKYEKLIVGFYRVKKNDPV